jgi:hypothetical protein
MRYHSRVNTRSESSLPTLDYSRPEPAVVGRPPVWVMVLAGAYALLLLGLAAVLTYGSHEVVVIAAGTGVLALELALLFTPVRQGRRRPLTRASLWIPILATGCCVGLLGWGMALALSELALGFEGTGDIFLVLAAIPAFLWSGWALVFWRLGLRRVPDLLAARLHRWLYAGSVLELLVAVPAHVVCRRRTECCAGIYTGLGIAIGIATMLLAFGPSIAILYFRRCRDIRPPPRAVPSNDPSLPRPDHFRPTDK